MKIRSKWVCLGALASALTVAAVAHAAYEKAPGKVLADFHAKGPLGLAIDGTAPVTEVVEKDNKLIFKVDLSEVDTDNTLRDGHTKDAVQASKHRYAMLAVPLAQINKPADGKTSSGSVPGAFSVNGKAKPVTVRYTAKRTGNKYTLGGSFMVDITQHGIKEPCFAGACVKKMVEVKLTVDNDEEDLKILEK